MHQERQNANCSCVAARRQTINRSKPQDFLRGVESVLVGLLIYPSSIYWPTSSVFPPAGGVQGRGHHLAQHRIHRQQRLPQPHQQETHSTLPPAGRRVQVSGCYKMPNKCRGKWSEVSTWNLKFGSLGVWCCHSILTMNKLTLGSMICQYCVVLLFSWV